MIKRILRPLLPVMCMLLFLSACNNKKPASTSNTSYEEPKQEIGAGNQGSQTTPPPGNSGNFSNLMNHLPPDWPDSAAVMPGFEVINSLVMEEGKVLVVNCIGNVNMDETQGYYAGLVGWSRYAPGPWITAGDHRYISLINDQQEKLQVSIMSKQEGTVLILKLDKPET